MYDLILQFLIMLPSLQYNEITYTEESAEHFFGSAMLCTSTKPSADEVIAFKACNA